MPDLSSFTQGTPDVAASDFLIGYVSAAGPGSERRWTAQDLTTGLLSLVGATPNEVAHLSGTTGNIQSQLNVVQSDVDAHEARVDNPHTVTATQVGLGSVDNVADVDKPVSTLQASAIGVVQSDVDAHEARVDNPHTVTATQVGLGNVDNTSDVDKPVSTLQQAAIDAAGGGAFDADADTLITPLTPIVLDQTTGNEAALSLDYTTNKLTSGDDTGLLVNQTDTNSPGTSKLMDLQVGGVSKFSVNNAGVGDAVAFYGQFFAASTGAPGAALGTYIDRFGLRLNSGAELGWTASTSAFTDRDLSIYRAAAATLQLGADVVTGTGADLTLSGGTGSVANGDVILEGGVVLPNLPTADPTNAGELWNDSGTLKVSAG